MSESEINLVLTALFLAASVDDCILDHAANAPHIVDRECEALDNVCEMMPKDVYARFLALVE